MIKLPPKTTAFKQWSEQLQTYAEFGLDADYWRSAIPEVPLLPRCPTPGEMTRSLEVVTETQMLLEITRLHNIQVHEILLTALTLTLQQWTGHSTFLIDLEGHGREDLFSNLDISRTVGWFTALYPVALTLTDTSLGNALAQIKATLRRIPHQGLGYGICRYLMNDPTLEILPQAEISFNYLGQFLEEQFSEFQWQLAPESAGATQAPGSPYLFEITASIVSGQLRINWSYNHNPTATIAHLLDQFKTHLQQILDYYQSPLAHRYIPADFALAELDQTQLETVLATISFGGES
jgi:non-ribosomal peptide synthase protein (TIGR01720 family)